MSYDNIFDASYKRVLETGTDGTDFFETFYWHFLRSSDLISEQFLNTDMEKQRRMLKKSFYSLISFYASGAADNVLEKIAYMHSARELDIKPALYDLWMDSLVVTVQDYDPEFNDNVELAWRLVMSLGITYMKFKYDRC